MGKSAIIRPPRPVGPVAPAQPPPLSLYVHLPWCLAKCPYCDFNSHPVGAAGEIGEAREREYLDALTADLEASLPLVWGRTVSSVFMGGGTPSLFSPRSIDVLMTAIRTLLRLTPDAEVTMEANPGTFETDRFLAFAQAGVNRLSVGVQSFDDAALGRLGRVHDARQAAHALEVAARAFRSFNVDLMYALPGQTLDALRADLRQALSFGPSHLSCYHLTLEPETPFAKSPPELPDDDASAAMQDEVEALLGAAGFEHYEVSAYARAGHRARHNLNYWTFGDYLGIGAGAHSKLSFHDRILRQARWRHPRRYVEGVRAGEAIDEARELCADDLPFEFMLNALRLTEGVPAALFTERTGLPVAAIRRFVDAAVDRGLLDPDPTRLRASALGARFLNDLQQLFLEET